MCDANFLLLVLLLVLSWSLLRLLTDVIAQPFLVHETTTG
jgi:uncharacterized RDD family membrane protein YckC